MSTLFEQHVTAIRKILFIGSKIACLALFGILIAGHLVQPAIAGTENTFDKQIQQSDEKAQKAEEKLKECAKYDTGEGCECNELVKSQNTSYGNCVDESQRCSKTGTTFYSCCICERLVDGDNGKTPVTEGFGDAATKGFTYSSCSEFCVQKFGKDSKPFAQIGAGTYPPPKTGAGVNAVQIQQNASLCFAATECQQVGGTLSVQADFKCPSGKGRCLAPEPEIKLSSPIGGVSSVKGFRNFVLLLFGYAIRISGVAAAVVFVFGGFQYMFGSAFGDIKSGKERMINALVGIVILFSSYTILQTINPATLSLNRLNVYMVNQDQMISNNFCADIKAANGKSDFLFANAGRRPEYTPLAQVKDEEFVVKQNETLCNVEYYGKGFGESRCNGSLCVEPGMGCVSCKSGVCAGGMTARDYGCVKGTWLGNISYKNSRYVESMIPIVVCNGALDKGSNDYKGAQEAMFKLGTLNYPKISGKQEDVGNQAYIIDVNEALLKDSQAYCNPFGGVAGFVLGIQYNDTSIGGTDEIAIVGKGDCGSGPLSGYMDGDVTSYDFSDMKRALWCGIYDVPGRLKTPSGYWSLSELRTAAGVDGGRVKPIECSFTLSDVNAPSDPVSSNKFMAGCTGRLQEMGAFEEALDFVFN